MSVDETCESDKKHRRLDALRKEHFMQVTTQRDADRRIGERLGDEVAIILADAQLIKMINEIKNQVDY